MSSILTPSKACEAGGISNKWRMTGWSGPKATPLATMGAKAYPIWPVTRRWIPWPKLLRTVHVPRFQGAVECLFYFLPPPRWFMIAIDQHFRPEIDHDNCKWAFHEVVRIVRQLNLNWTRYSSPTLPDVSIEVNWSIEEKKQKLCFVKYKI